MKDKEKVELMLYDAINNRNNIYIDEPMNKHTSFRIGGTADYFIKITSINELKDILKIAKKFDVPVFIAGNGTNLLVKDGGIRGFVLKLELKDFSIKRNNDEIIVTVESGLTLAALANISIKEEITGFEFLAGIPGTIGGAVRMNAGAYGSEIKDVLVKTKYMTYDGKIKTLDLKDHEFEYRNSIFSKLDGIIIETTLVGHSGKKEKIENKIKELNEARKEKQPLEYPSAGSTFKRMEGYIASKLIDECGLKGYSIGDAEVSTKHAGFIINKGNASADDVLSLINYVKKKVKSEYDVNIEMEILVIGEE